MEVLAYVALVVADLAVLGGALAWGWRRLGDVRQMAVDWHGAPQRKDPAGIVIEEARPGVQGRLVRLEDTQAEVKAKVAAIEKELQPNSGGSFHDVVRKDIAALKAAVTELREEQRSRPVVEASNLGFQAERADLPRSDEASYRVSR